VFWPEYAIATASASVAESNVHVHDDPSLAATFVYTYNVVVVGPDSNGRFGATVHPDGTALTERVLGMQIATTM
jgi:hypothetical protein